MLNIKQDQDEDNDGEDGSYRPSSIHLFIYLSIDPLAYWIMMKMKLIFHYTTPCNNGQVLLCTGVSVNTRETSP